MLKLRKIKIHKNKIERKRMNKKANFVAWFFVLIVIMAFSIFALILNKAWSEIETPMAETLEKNMPSDTDVNVTEILGGVGNTTQNFSNMLPFLIIGLFAFIMITAGALLRHPILIFVGIIVLGVLLLIATVFSNVYTSISETTSFKDTSDDLAIQGKFMDFLPIIIFILAIGIAAFVLYSKSSGGSGNI